MASQRPESPEADDQEETQGKRSIDTPASPEIAATELLKAAGLVFETGAAARTDANDGGRSG